MDPTVYIVDDDDAVRDSLRTLLRAYGRVVREFASGSAFLDNFDPTMPSCLVLDQALAGASGLELVETLRRRGIGLPVVLTFDVLNTPTRSRADRAGVVALLCKPYAGCDLIAAIDTALKSTATAVAGLRG